MQIVVVEPSVRTLSAIQTDDPNALFHSFHLLRGGAEHGEVLRHLAIIVEGYGFLRDAQSQRYVKIGPKYFAGKGVLYGHDRQGRIYGIETNELHNLFEMTRFLSAQELENEIAAGYFPRPTVKINNEIVWQWNPCGGDAMSYLQERINAEEAKGNQTNRTQ